MDASYEKGLNTRRECKAPYCKNETHSNDYCKEHWEGRRDFGGLVPKCARASGDMGV